MLEKIYLLFFSLAILCVLALFWFIWQVVHPYIGMIGEGFALLFDAVVFSLFVLILVASFHLCRVMAAIANRFVMHERLVTHKDTAFWIDEEGMPLHVSAIHESAKISTFALEQAHNRKLLEAELSTPHKDLSEDAIPNQINNLLSQGKSERAIAKTMNITRSEVRKLLGK